MSKTTKTARCNCGKVQVQVSGDDKEAVHCYCVNCQRASGTAFAHNHRFIDAQIKVLKGEDQLKCHEDGDTDSGNILYRHFCGNCGSPMFLKSDVTEGWIALHEGSMEGEKTQPVTELYVQEKHKWFGNVIAGERKTTPFPWDPDA